MATTPEHDADEFISWWSGDERIERAIRSAAARRACAPSDTDAAASVRRLADMLAQRHPQAVAEPADHARACRAIDQTIDMYARHIDDMHQRYQTAVPQTPSAAAAFPEIAVPAHADGMRMLKDPALRNVCLNIAFEMARIQACSAGRMSLDEQSQNAMFRRIVDAWLDRHGQDAPDMQRNETAHWLNQQVIVKSNSLLRVEVAKLFESHGTLPDPDRGEYDTELLARREILHDEYMSYPPPMRPAPTRNHEQAGARPDTDGGTERTAGTSPPKTAQTGREAKSVRQRLREHIGRAQQTRELPTPAPAKHDGRKAAR